MIQLPVVELSLEAHQQLVEYQAEIDGLATYAERVKQAKKKFPQRNRDTNATFREVRRKLHEMCSGVRRCAYCEDSVSDEVEHIRPKDLYPDAVFCWDNYLYACGRCNGPKNNHWAVFSQATGALTEVRRNRGDPVVPPEEGEPVFINPRLEDPLALMKLDLRGTFRFVSTAPEATRGYERTEYTIRILDLNDADVLTSVRGAAYEAYLSLLDRYIRRRDAGAPQARLDLIVTAVGNLGQRTVWEEMKRQRLQIDEIKELFDRAPEALDW
jgi:uncharacterized protein (TIGR02646 family)